MKRNLLGCKKNSDQFAKNRVQIRPVVLKSMEVKQIILYKHSFYRSYRLLHYPIVRNLRNDLLRKNNLVSTACTVLSYSVGGRIGVGREKYGNAPPAGRPCATIFPLPSGRRPNYPDSPATAVYSTWQSAVSFLLCFWLNLSVLVSVL